MGKGENAGNQHFLLFPLFSILPKPNLNFSVTAILSSVSDFNLDQSKILSFGKDLNPFLKSKAQLPTIFTDLEGLIYKSITTLLMQEK